MEFQTQRWKPRAKAIMAIEQLPLDRELTIQVKADGEFSVISYEKNVQVFSVNLWGTYRGESDPWLKELKEALDRQPIEKAVILAETYSVEEGKMLKLPETIHHLKNGDLSKIRLGVFDLVSVNGKTANQSYLWRLQELETWLKDCRLVHVLPYIQPKCYHEIFDFWRHWVQEQRFEGLFARDNRQDLYKIKPFLTIDCAVIGLNKREKWKEKEVTSLKLALLDTDGSFIEIGDVASGIDHQLRVSLYNRLTPLAKREYDTWVQVPPFIVAEVEATETFRAQKPRYILKDGLLEPSGVKEAHSLRHPRLIRFRGEKKATIEDIGYERQLPS